MTILTEDQEKEFRIAWRHVLDKNKTVCDANSNYKWLIPFCNGEESEPIQIEDFKKVLSEMESEGATHFYFDCEVCEFSIHDARFTPAIIETESEEDHKIRIDELKQMFLNRQNSDLENEKAEYERLKLKFES